MIPAVGRTQTPRPGGTLNFVAPYDGDLYGLDPHKCTRIQEFLVLMNIYRSLYRWDPDKSMPVLDLATKVRRLRGRADLHLSSAQEREIP